jgi:hypothetical protein
MLKKTALATGAVLLVGGVLGFVPGMSTTDADGQQMLFGIFMVGPFHNAFHLVSGVVGLFAAVTERSARWYLRIFGLVYAVLAVLGFVIGIDNVNVADHLLHAVVAVVLLMVGFGAKGEDRVSMPVQS